MKTVLVILSLALTGISCARFKAFGYEGFFRDRWQQPANVMESLGIVPGSHVVDLGAGGGYFTFKFADAVGTSGKVYAVDVDKEMTEYLQKQIRKRGYSNIEVILGEFRDPLLPDSLADLIFICNTYHHIANRVDYFARLKTDLKSDGQVAIIDLRPGGWLGKLFGSHWTDESIILEEMLSAGYSIHRKYDYLPKQHFLVFSARTD